jgi:flagellar biogenesis protein FliO
MYVCQRFSELQTLSTKGGLRSITHLFAAVLLLVAWSSSAQAPAEITPPSDTPPVETPVVDPAPESSAEHPESESAPDKGDSKSSIDEVFDRIMKDIDADADDSQGLPKMLMGLSVVLAMILIVYSLVRRFGKHVPALSGLQLGQVLGQVHLTRTATLHYVKSGGRILVIGVNEAGVNLVAEFDEVAFDTQYPDMDVQGSFDPDTFVQELKGQSASMRGEEVSLESGGMKDDEISALRGDLHRLQEYLQDETRDQND